MVLLNNKRKSKKGFSLLELLLVLGIIAALVVAAFIVYPKVQALHVGIKLYWPDKYCGCSGKNLP